MTSQEEELINSYKEDFYKKTGKYIHCDLERKSLSGPDHTVLEQIVNNYIKAFGLEYKDRPKYVSGRTIGATSDIMIYMHILRYILYYQYHLLQKEVAFYTNTDRTTIYNSVSRIKQYIDTEDDKLQNAVIKIDKAGFDISYLLKEINGSKKSVSRRLEQSICE